MEQTITEKKGINANALKWIAIVTMFIDHIGAAVLEKNGQIFWNPDLLKVDLLLRGIGRIAFPIFCFLLVEGITHTHNRWKYLFNMALFALIAEYPFDLAFRGGIAFDYQSVFMTLFFGLLAMIICQIIEEKQWKLKIPVMLLAGACCAALAQFCNTDYGAIGVILIFVLYITRNNRLVQCICGAVCFIWEVTSVISFVLIYFYNGVRKKGMNKYFFYLFYPAHLLILYAIRRLFFE